MKAIMIVPLLLGTATATAHAEGALRPPAPRQGYYLSLGVAGVESLVRDSEHHDQRALHGASGTLRAGEMIDEWVGFGLRLDFGVAQDDLWQASLGGFGVDAQLVPWDHLALHLGAGLGSFEAESRRDAEAKARTTGGAYYSAGVTYDFFLTGSDKSGGFAVAPGLFVKYLPGDYRSLILWAGVEMSFWSGLPRQALELGGDEAFRRE
jgi:hypothetical protein